MHTANIHGLNQSVSFQQGTDFTVMETQIACQYKLQFYVDYGSTDKGPWLKIGINSTEMGVGYLPKLAHHVAEKSAS